MTEWRALLGSKGVRKDGKESGGKKKYCIKINKGCVKKLYETLLLCN